MLAERGLPDLPNILGAMRQRLEDRGERLALALPGLVQRKRGELGRLAPRLPHPREGIAARRAMLALLQARGRAAWGRIEARGRTAPPIARFSSGPVESLLREKRLRLEGLAARLEGGSFQSVLSRGFALVRDAEGAPITSATDVPPGARLVLTFADGEAQAIADGTKPAPKRKPREEPAQETLL
jgi:exodeoxyribonuclease VII large subunit